MIGETDSVKKQRTLSDGTFAVAKLAGSIDGTDADSSGLPVRSKEPRFDDLFIEDSNGDSIVPQSSLVLTDLPPCRFFAAGTCALGAGCKFGHGAPNGAINRPILCQYHLKGQCREGAKCRFQHPMELGVGQQCATSRASPMPLRPLCRYATCATHSLPPLLDSIRLCADATMQPALSGTRSGCRRGHPLLLRHRQTQRIFSGSTQQSG